MTIFERVILEVPYEKKDELKVNGALWDNTAKHWYAYIPLDDKNDVLEKYRLVYVDVAYSDKETVKSSGFKWDATNKRWYTYKSNPKLSDLINLQMDLLYNNLNDPFSD